jgi:hypothetical protein
MAGGWMKSSRSIKVIETIFQNNIQAKGLGA